MRRSLHVSCLLFLVVLSGCALLMEDEPLPRLRVTVTPDRARPPFVATITATDMGYGNYELIGHSGPQPEREFTVTVASDPWAATLRWVGYAGDFKSVEVGIEVINAPPAIYPPRLPGNRWEMTPLERTLVSFAHRPASMYHPGTLGIYDPDGDPWRIVSVSVHCSQKAVEDSIFTPPYEPGVFHADGEDSAFVVYPTYTGEIDAETGLPYPPIAEAGYPWTFRDDTNTTLPERRQDEDGRWLAGWPAQTAAIRVVAEDEWGARAEASFDIPVSEDWIYTGNPGVSLPP